MMHESTLFERRVHWLGYLGVLPFLLGSGWVLADPASATAQAFFKNYAAVILTFVGAIHWGRAMHTRNTRLITVSVLPSLFAWVCIMLPFTTALPLLSAGFIMLWLLDSHQYRHADWFRQMRLQLTVMVVFLLLVTWLVAG